MSKFPINKRKLLKISIVLAVFSFFSFNSALASEITENKVIELVNKARVEYGVEPLTPNEKLTKAAGDKAEDMVKNGYFSHTSPKGATPWVWFDKNNYDYKYAGENLAMDFLTSESQQKAWMESETHRKNILNPEFQEVGVAVKQGLINGKITIITVQEFGSRTDYVKPASKKINVNNNEKASKRMEVKGVNTSNNKKADNFMLETFQTSLLVLIFMIVVVINPIILAFKMHEFLAMKKKDKLIENI